MQNAVKGYNYYSSKGAIDMSEKPKLPDNNPCVYKMVSHCYYQDTSRQMNQTTCSNCILSRVEKHLFSLVSATTPNKGKTIAKKIVEGLPHELSNRDAVPVAGS